MSPTGTDTQICMSSSAPVETAPDEAEPTPGPEVQPEVQAPAAEAKTVIAGLL